MACHPKFDPLDRFCLRHGRQTPRRLSPLVSLSSETITASELRFLEQYRGSRTANARRSRPGLVPARRRGRARRPPPLFACRPPVWRDGQDYGAGLEQGDKFVGYWPRTPPRPRSSPSELIRGNCTTRRVRPVQTPRVKPEGDGRWVVRSALRLRWDLRMDPGSSPG